MMTLVPLLAYPKIASLSGNRKIQEVPAKTFCTKIFCDINTADVSSDNLPLISCPYKQLRYPALTPVPSPMLGRGVPTGRGEVSYNNRYTDMI